MQGVQNASAVGMRSDRLMWIADLLLEAHQVVNGQDIRAALDTFRRLDRSVPRPMAVSDYALSSRRAHSLLQSVGMSEALAHRVFNIFSRHPRSVNTWSRVVGEAPDRHVDALVLFVGLVLICRATLKNKLTILFSLFDSGRTGVLTEDDLGAMISACSSFLHHVGLSLPISNDEAAFAAGGAFASRFRPRNSISDDGVENAWVDELDLPMFLAWALRAELPVRVYELLSLPHRLSMSINIVSAKLASLRKRRLFGGEEGHSQQGLKTAACTCQECFMHSSDLCRPQHLKASTVRSQRLQHKNGAKKMCFSFTLPPVLSFIGAHEACAMLEVNPGGTLTAEGSMWHVVIALEERIGPRFSVIESKFVPLRGGVPLALRLSGLRAATDHRVQLRWNGSEQLQHRHAGRQRKHSGRRGCDTLRFATLPGVSSDIPESTRAYQSTPRIAIVSAANRAPIDGSSGVLPRLAHSTGRRAGEKSTAEKSVSVVINYRRTISLKLVTSLDVAEPWWVSVVRSDSTAHDVSDQGHTSLLSWPPRKVSLPPEAAKLAPAALTNLNAAPFCGDRVTAEAGTAPREAWPETGEREEGVNIMVHFSPRWKAEATVRRCLNILKVCRFENAAVREDARCMVSREICKAIVVLLRKSSRPRGRTLRHKITRSCAHVVVGDIDTWLGLAEEEVETHDKEHRDIVRLAAEAALQRYLWDPGMCGGGGAFSRADGGAMALGCGCFLIRPAKKEKSCPETAVLAKTEAANLSNSQIEVVSDEAQGRNDLGTENAANMTAGLESTEIGSNFSRTEGGVVEETTVQGAGEERASNDVEHFVADGMRETTVVTLEADEREPEVVRAMADGAGSDRVASDSEHDREATPLSGITHRPEDKASDHDAEGRSCGPEVPHENPVLVALLRTMTKAAEESAPQAMEAGGIRTAKKNMTLTVIIILDAPLVSSNTPGGPAADRSQHWQDLSNLPERTSEERRSDSRSTTGGRATDGDFSNEHPAGLGDPSEALRALVSWTKEGPASADGRREVLLVCGNSYGNGNTTESGRQEHDDFDDGSSRKSSIVGGQTLDTESSDKGFRGDVKAGGSHDDVIHAEDASIPAREIFPIRVPRNDEVDIGGSGQEIRQVVLRRVTTSRIGQKNPSIAKEDVGETHKLRTASVTPSEEQDRVDHNGSANAPSMPQAVQAIDAPPPPLVSHYSEAYFQIRPAMIEGKHRVVVSFPPLDAVPFTSARSVDRSMIDEIARASERTEQMCVTTSTRDGDRLPRVVVGPVIGRVGPTSAVVLLEVDEMRTALAHAEERPSVDVGVRLIDTLSGRRHDISGGVWTGVSGSGPRVFEFETLAPGRRYALRLLGVRQKDQISRTGALCTPLEGEGPAAMWALSMLACPATAVDEILADIQTARPTASVTLPVGPMVDASKVAEALYPMMITAKNKTLDSSKGEGGVSLGDHALDAFRQLYRDALGEPRARKFLANCSTTSTGGAADLLLPLLRLLPAGWLLTASSSGHQPRQTNTASRRRKRTSRARNCEANPKIVVGIKGALTEVASAALQASKEYHETLWGMGSRSSGCGGGERGVVGKGPLPRFQRWGPVGVLNVSSFSSQVDLALGQKHAGRGLLSSETWAWLEDFFRSPEICLQEGPGLNTLIVVTDSPLVWRSPSAARAAEFRPINPEKNSDDAVNFDDLRDAEKPNLPKRGSPCSGSPHSVAPSWSSQPRETAAFLGLLFAWAGNSPVEVEIGRKKSAGSVASTSSVDRQAGEAVEQQEPPGQGFSRVHTNSGGSRITRQVESAEGGARDCRAFTIVCPAARVRMNIKTCLKDSETGRVALQWCLASKEGGDESHISMSGSIGPRFSFTHYPQGGKENGPGVTLLRPIPNASAPSVTFLGMSPLKSGGPGFAFGTLGPVLGEIGTTAARVLVEVSVPMELRLTVKRAGSENGDQSGAPADRWQQLKKVVRVAHRPVVFDVDHLIPDTRYLLDFSPLANARTFRASLRTRALRPFSFRVAAFGGCRNPFGFAEALTAGRSATFDGVFPPDTPVAIVPLRKRWPYCAVDPALAVTGATGRVGDDTGQRIREGRARTSTVAPRGWGPLGGGWRNSVSTSLAIEAATDGSQLEDMARDSLLGEGSDAELVCKELCGRSAWKALSEEVQLPLQGLDLVIHMGNEIHAAAYLSGTEVTQLKINSSNWAEPPSEGPSTAGSGGRPFTLVDPPHLPVDDDGLRASDEEHISKLEDFLAQVHDNSERERKRGEGRNNAGESPNRPKIIDEPSLDIKIPGNERFAVETAGISTGGPATVRISSGGGGDDQDGDTVGSRNGGIGPVKSEEDSWGDAEAWRLATEEVAERVRDAYRIAWGLPWAKSVMASTPNTSLAFTPLDLDDGYQRIPTKPTASPDTAGNTEAGDSNTRDHPASVPRLREEALRAWVEYQSALAGDLTPEETSEAGDGTGAKKRSDKRETDRAAYREYGGIGILTLDVWGNQRWRLDETGVESAKGGEGPGFHPKALLSKRQEKLIKRALASPSTNALLVCSGTPMVAEPVVHPKAPPLGEAEQKERDKTLKYAKKELKKLGKAGLAEIKRLETEEKAPKLSMLSPEQVGAMAPFYDETRPCFQWSYHSPYLQELLEKLFDWANAGAVSGKKDQPRKKRDVVLVCGGTGCGVKTVVADKRTGISFNQVCVGRMSDATVPCPWPLFEGAIGDRIVYTHSPISTPSEAQSNARNTSGRSYRDSDARTDAHLRETTTRAPTRTTAGVGALGRGDRIAGRQQQQGDGGLDSEALLAATDRGASSYALVTVLSEPLDANIDAVLVQPPFSTDGINRFEPTENEGGSISTNSTCTSSVASSDQRVAIILGPVLGRVEVVRQTGVVRESCRVPVVLEVDRDGAVTCLMRDVATSEVFRLERAMKGRRPRAFWMQGLRPMRRYTIEFEGVVNGADRQGSLRTPNNSDPDLTIVAVSHDQPGELPSVGETNLWSALGKKLGSPWQGVDVMIHIGGQVDLTNAFEDGRACLETLEIKRRNGRISEVEEASIMAKLKERFREEYRKVWNQPSTRQVLSSCQHVMMWGQGECRRGYGRGRHAAVASWAGRRLLRLAKEVFREYQRQLWDPLWGSRFQVRDDESFYTTFLWGTVGVFSLDALEMDPQWDIGDKLASVGGRGGGHEEPMIGNSQWQRLNDVLENDEDLITLIVVTDVPIAWYDTEAFFAEMKEETPAVPKHLEDHWAARPKQQRALLTRLFRWKADGGGREILLLAGAGRAEGCAAAETKLEFKMPSGEGGQGTGIAKPGGRGGGVEREDATEENAQTKANARSVGISQVACGPITAEPMDSSGGQKPARGKILVPETEADKAEKLQRRINSGGGARVVVEEPEPVGFVHIKTPGRNYAVLQVIADHDEEGPIGVVDTALATVSSLDKAHPTQELACPPGWWSKRFVGDRTVLFDDDVYMKSREFQATMDARLWLETSDDFKQATSRCYEVFYIADAGRPEELRTIKVEQSAVLKRHIEDAIRAVYRSIPPEIASELAYVPDQMILDFLLLKACPEMKASAVDTGEKWEEVCRQTCTQAAFIRVAALWAEEEEEVALTADARVEEASRKAKAKEKLQREKEVKEAERDVLEMAKLLESDPEAHMRRVVQKRADDADRRRREAKLNAEKTDAAGQAQEILEKKKAEDGERLARETKEREAKEQQELNDLADTDPVEYDRRIKEWHKKKIEERHVNGGGFDTGSSDDTDRNRIGQLEQRRALARERRNARRAEMHKRPSIGIPK